jgi:hypothetical protein
VAKKKAAKKKVPRKKSNALSRIQPLEYYSQFGMSMLLYGRSGTGKTRFWGTIPGKTLCLIVSGGKNPEELKSINSPANCKRIKCLPLQTVSDIQDIVDHQNKTQEYDNIIVDHITGLQELVLAETLGLDRIPEQLSWGIATRETWGTVALKMKKLLRTVLDLQCNRILIGQERDFGSDSENDVVMSYVSAAVSPSVIGWLEPAVSYLCQTYKRQRTETKRVKIGGKTKKITKDLEGVEYVLRIGPHATYSTRFRVPEGTELPRELVDPTFPKLLSLMKTRGVKL